MSKDGTSTLLVTDLEEQQTFEKTLQHKEEYKRIIDKAKQFEYDTYNSKSALPKTDLHADLIIAQQKGCAGIKVIITELENGKYDKLQSN